MNLLRAEDGMETSLIGAGSSCRGMEAAMIGWRKWGQIWRALNARPRSTQPSSSSLAISVPDPIYGNACSLLCAHLL